MYSTIVKRILLLLSVLISVSLACDVAVNIVPTNEVPNVTSTPVHVIDPPTPTPEIFISLTQAIPATATPASTVPSSESVLAFYRPLSLVLPTGLASGISGADIPRVDGQDHPAWELTPGHTVVKLEGYSLHGKFHQPQIYVYPAMAYVELFPGAFESMHRLRNVMNPVAPLTPDQLPAVPFFNAAQLFASDVQAIPFQNGSGIRFLTEYGQYPAPVSNHELFYHFQGFTSDGEFYIVAVLPITAHVLAETGDAGATLPAGGIQYPFFADPNAETLQKYYEDVANLLSATPNEAFTPAIGQLDALIQSMQIMP